MPCISGTFDSKIGILLEITVSPAQSDHGQQSAPAPRVASRGLADTGASRTCISTGLAQKLNLPAKGKINLTGATGQKAVNTYLVDFELAFGSGMAAKIKDLLVLEFDGFGDGNNFEVLIGRDVLFQGVFTTAFTQHFTFSL